MGASEPLPSHPPSTTSALHRFLETHPPPPHQPREPHTLALQIAHNLRFQHAWSDVRIHYFPLSSSSALSSSPSLSQHSPQQQSQPQSQSQPQQQQQTWPRPLLSGLPPRRLYVHPDEQIALLQRRNAAGKAGMPALTREREWVLPSHLREKWSLRRFGEAFDAIGWEPRRGDGEALFAEPGAARGKGRGERVEGAEEDDEDEDEEDEEEEEGDGDGELETREKGENAWRTSQPKRLLLATLDDDSTVVYYIVHDGVVKPRQN